MPVYEFNAFSAMQSTIHSVEVSLGEVVMENGKVLLIFFL